MKTFDHEKLIVYQRSLEFCAWAGTLLERLPKNLAVHNQLDRASTSIPLNIAEGTAKNTAADRCRFFDTARGSAVECAACLDVLVTRHLLVAQEIADGKALLIEVVAMLIGLIRATDDNRIREDAPPYSIGGEQGQVQG